MHIANEAESQSAEVEVVEHKRTSHPALNALAEVRRLFDGDGIFSVGANAALSAMESYWANHLSQGETPQILLDDMGGLITHLQHLCYELGQRLRSIQIEKALQVQPCGLGAVPSKLPANSIVEIYADGACRGNPGAGGWGALILVGGRETELSGAESGTTNNRMELMAAIRALEKLTSPCTIKVQTDSQYVVKGMTEWLPDWKANGWRTASKRPVKNQDLWQRLENAASIHRIEWNWIPGHAGIAGNERVDRLANNAIESLSVTARREQ